MMRDFHNGEIAVLIATDVASRGLHIPDVSHVFNFDLPNDAEDYVHRIGRTARASASGRASSFAAPEEHDLLRGIEKFTRKPVDRAAVPREDEAFRNELTRRASEPVVRSRGGGGGRPHGGGGSQQRRGGGGGVQSRGSGGGQQRRSGGGSQSARAPAAGPDGQRHVGGQQRHGGENAATQKLGTWKPRRK
jgi:superfamily II DNA/RNA helicase